MSTTIMGVVTNGVVVPSSPLPEGARVEVVVVLEKPLPRGVPAEHLVAAGYGEFQPLESGVDEDSLRKNRRIELKLTNR